MRKDIKGIEEALKILKKQNVIWVTVNRIQNRMWDTGVAFFGRGHCRVAYYDEVQNVISIN